MPSPRALVAQRTGGGAFIDVSLLESTLAAMGWVVSNHLIGNVEPQPMGNENFTAAPSGTFRTGDGPLNIAANEQKQYETLCDLVGRPDLEIDPRFADRESRKVNRAALTVELERRPSDPHRRGVGGAVQRNGVPAGSVLSVPEILAEEQVRPPASRTLDDS